MKSSKVIMIIQHDEELRWDEKAVLTYIDNALKGKSPELKVVVSEITVIHNPEQYSDEIMDMIRQRLGLDEGDTSRDKFIMSVSKNHILDEVCDWEGLIHYGPTIRDWIQSIYGIELQ